MPIGDLLASITGEKPSTPAPLHSRPISAPKRKADTELPGSASKTPRINTTANGTHRPNGSQPSSTSRLPDRPLPSSSTNSRPASVPRPSARPGNTPITKVAQNTPSRNGHSPNGNWPLNGSRSMPASATAKITTAVDSGPKAGPKKRSFAEIMARAKAAQAAMPQKLGTIQHKKIEAGMMKRERAEVKAVEARQAAKLVRQGGARPGAHGPPSQSRHGTHGAVKTANGTSTNGSGRRAAPVVEEKKVKKAALATTGYTGTARPRPGASSGRPNGLISKSGADSRAPRYGGPLSGSRRRYEDEDDELDDFIEYDDDEDEPGYGAPRRGGYDSPEEDESDMEAGMTDVEEEERRAAAIALKEDREQKALELRLKREKEEKRRKMMEAAKRRA